MAIIDPEGLFHGERLGACSDVAQLYWPRFFLAANGFGRMELSYSSIISKIFGNFQKVPAASVIWGVFEEYARHCLVILYEHEGVWWAQFHTSAKYLPRYMTARDMKSPVPSAEQLEQHQKEYVAWKAANSVRNESFRKNSEDFGKFRTERRGVVVGVGGVVGVGAKQGPGAEAPCDLPPWLDTEAWNAYEEMRNKARKGMTPRARELVLKKLAGFEARGMSSTEALNLSVVNNWTDVYEPKGKTGGNGNGKPTEQQNIDAKAEYLRDRTARRMAAEQDHDRGADQAGGASAEQAGIGRADGPVLLLT